MLDDRRMRQRRDRAAQRSGTSGWRMVKRADMRLVDQAARRRTAAVLPPAAGGSVGDDRLRHQRRRVAARAARRRQPRVVGIGPVDRHGIGIDQQLVGIEPGAAVGIVVAVGAQAVARAGGEARHEQAYAGRRPAGCITQAIRSRDCRHRRTAKPRCGVGAHAGLQPQSAHATRVFGGCAHETAARMLAISLSAGPCMRARPAASRHSRDDASARRGRCGCLMPAMSSAAAIRSASACLRVHAVLAGSGS